MFAVQENVEFFKWRNSFAKGGVHMKPLQEPQGKYIKIRCSKCKNEQIMFGKASSLVHCLVCSKLLAEPTGGKARVKARVLEVLE